MRCTACGCDSPSHAKFCAECGRALTARCGACGTELPPPAKFCLECGTKVVVGAVQPTAPRETPRHLADKILTSRAAIEGERKQVTVLFADMKGSLELLADRDPEDARQILDPVVERMMEAVHRYEGTVNNAMGDGIMALFGAPIAHEDHAIRACYAALRMQDSVRRYAEDVHRTIGVPIHIRVGLNSGEVVVRSVGNDLRMDYAAVGETTHLAARMEQMAMPGCTQITEHTLRLAEGYVQVKPLGPRPVKGLPSPVDVYELLGATAAQSRLQARGARELTRFAGRAAELAQLGDALRMTLTGKGQIVGVVGEPGIGKSRLFWEFLHAHLTSECLVLESASVSYATATTYYPVIALLRGYFQIEPRDDTRSIKEKVVAKLFTLGTAIDLVPTPFLALFDVPVDDDAWMRLDPQQRRQRTLDAVTRLFLQASQVQPLIVVVEDLHWMDGESLAVLDRLAQRLPNHRLLLLVNYRPEYQPGWGSKGYYRQLRIDALPPATAEDVLVALLGPDPALDLIKRLLITRTEGNPFFIEESVRTLVETKLLIGVPGAYRLTQVTDGLQIPATAQAVLEARIDRLSAEDKRLLQAASVIGRELPYALLQAVTEESEDTLREGLTRLQAADFLDETRIYPESEYAFRHALTHEVAYHSILRERRGSLHTRIADAIERQYPDRLAEHIERIAHHAFNGGAWDKAALYLPQAGTRAVMRSAHREAAMNFRQAVTALDHLPESRAVMEKRFDVRIQLRNALFANGEHERALEYLRQAEQIATALDDQTRLARVLCLIGNYFWWTTADNDRAFEATQRALGIAAATGDFALQIVANFYAGEVYLAQGDYRHACELFARNVESLTGEQVYDRFGMAALPSVVSRGDLARCLAEQGDFAASEAWGQDALSIAETTDRAFELVYTCQALGFALVRRGAVDRAIPLLERGLHAAETSEIPQFFSWTAATLGYAHALAGRVSEGAALLERAVDRAVAVKAVGLHSLWVAHLGEAVLLAGDRAKALALARQSLELSRHRSERGHAAWALRILGLVYAQMDASDRRNAEDCYREALALATELGMRPLVAHCHAGLADLSRRDGRQLDVVEHMRAATELYRELGMTLWLQAQPA